LCHAGICADDLDACKSEVAATYYVRGTRSGGILIPVDDVWIEVAGYPSWVRADEIVQIFVAGTRIDAVTAGGGETGNNPTLATEVPDRAFGLALLESIAQARLLTRKHGSAVILSWLGGTTGGWRMETVDARQARLRAQGRL
jgi:hypothetical protein